MSLRLLFSFFLFSLVLSSCDREPIGPRDPDPAGPGSYMSIAALRSLYTNTGDVLVPANAKKFIGVVISNSLNEASGNFRIQDTSGAGIYLYIPGAPAYVVGDVLEVDAAGVGVLTLFNGDLELKSVPLNRVRKISTSLNVTPRIATVAEVKANVNSWSSTLVTINNVTISKNGPPNGTGQNYNIVDATGSIVSFVRNAANITVLEGGASSITGYVSIFQSTTQLTIRDSSDIKNGGQGGTGGGSGIALGTSPYLIDFNNIGVTLPPGVTVVTGASATSAGIAGTFSSSPSSSLWNRTSAGFKNYASATGLSQGADSATQASSANRALGVRQTSSTGYDPGAAFVFMINNTTGKNNLSIEFRLQSLDTSSAVGRTTTWTVDYGIGDNPTSFTQATATGTLTTGNKVFSNNLITVSLPAALSNQSQKVWIRILTLTPTTGANNRTSTAIDDVKFLWN